jgi:hypothetical protein
MSSLTIPNLKLFPLYTGGPILNGKNGLNANSQYVIPATRYRQSYAVNIAPTSNSYDPNTYYAFNASNPRLLTAKATSSASAYNTPLALSSSKTGRLTATSVPNTAPEIPNTFKDRVANYTVSDANYAALMAQADFRLPNVGMGLKVVTDGNGNVDTISINPSSLGTMRRTNAVGHDLGVLNRSKITTGAIYKVNDPGFSFSNIDKTGQLAQKQKPSQSPSAAGALGSAKLPQNAGIFNAQPGKNASLNGLDALDGINLLLARLDQLQPQDAGLSLSGAEAGVDLEQARQVAANQADYGVKLSSNFYQSVAGVVSAAKNQQQDSYAASFSPRLERVMDGRVNVNPWQLPQQANSGPLTAPSTVSFQQGAAVADATAGNAKNGYIPFKMQNNGASAGEGNPFLGQGTQTGGQTGGSGFQGGMQSGNGRQPGQQLPYYRKALAYTA